MEQVSDIDTNGLGQFGIQWDGDFGPHWQWFNTEAERDARLAEYAKEISKNDHRVIYDPVNDFESDAFFEMEEKINRYENGSLTARPW